MTARLPAPTERLIFRDFEEADWAAVHDYATDLEVVRFMPWGPNSEKDTKAFVRLAMGYQGEEPRWRYELAVVLRDTGRLIGACGLRRTRPGSPQANMGYVFRRDMWGKGYGAEAARAVVAFGFEALGLHRIFATCDVENFGSSRVLEKAGMRREGEMLEHMRIGDRWRDSYLYAVLEHEWREANAGR